VGKILIRTRGNGVASLLSKLKFGGAHENKQLCLKFELVFYRRFESGGLNGLNPKYQNDWGFCGGIN
jgi:hypothetical protein